MASRKPLLNVLFFDERWKKLPSSWQREVECGFEKAASLLEKDFSEQELSVVFTDNKAIQELNKTFRHYNKPTNVLSFPSEEKEELGDIILAYETIEKEAFESGISLLHHTLHLIIHGFLHLLGYDHEEEEAAEIMENLEIQILASLNITNPYEDR